MTGVPAAWRSHLIRGRERRSTGRALTNLSKIAEVKGELPVGTHRKLRGTHNKMLKGRADNKFDKMASDMAPGSRGRSQLAAKQSRESQALSRKQQKAQQRAWRQHEDWTAGRKELLDRMNGTGSARSARGAGGRVVNRDYRQVMNAVNRGDELTPKQMKAAGRSGVSRAAVQEWNKVRSSSTPDPARESRLRDNITRQADRGWGKRMQNVQDWESKSSRERTRDFSKRRRADEKAVQSRLERQGIHHRNQREQQAARHDKESRYYEQTYREREKKAYDDDAQRRPGDYRNLDGIPDVND